MKITILGTAAAEGWPAVFCACETCKRARAAGGKNVRSRQAVQFGSTHRVDFGPDTWYHEAHLGADLSQLQHLFISHSHGDHWRPETLNYLKPPFAHENRLPLNLYGNDVVISTGQHSVGQPELPTVAWHELAPFESVAAGGMVVTPIVASHKPGELCLNYVFESECKRILCAWDTGWYEDERTWIYLEGLRLDCVIAECTCGPVKCERYHMDFEHLFAFQERLRNAGTISDETVFIVTHFSHNVGLLHEELEHVFNPRGIQVAYDGMKFDM